MAWFCSGFAHGQWADIDKARILSTSLICVLICAARVQRPCKLLSDLCAGGTLLAQKLLAGSACTLALHCVRSRISVHMWNSVSLEMHRTSSLGAVLRVCLPGEGPFLPNACCSSCGLHAGPVHTVSCPTGTALYASTATPGMIFFAAPIDTQP